MKLQKITFLALAVSFSLSAFAQEYQMKPIQIQTNWAKNITPIHTHDEYPRPQLVRKNWVNLNGLWDYAITNKDENAVVKWDGKILVPYPLESALSGVKKSLGPDELLWYKRTFEVSDVRPSKLILHFGAVDYKATIKVNGKVAGQHSGGYTAFDLDVTDLVKQGTNELIVEVFDPSDRGLGPHGKQVLNPQSIYYTPSSGIWQTVWLESVPKKYIDHLTVTPDIDKSVVNITVHSDSSLPAMVLFAGKSYTGKSNQSIVVPVKNAKLWSPENPHLYNFSASLGEDNVNSYFGMRKVSIIKDANGFDRIALNNQPYFNLGTLDQGFWPDGLYTAPNDEALAFDIKAIKAMGFNTIRKHIKVEPARWYYHADRLGMLVWQDMVNPNQRLPEGSKQAFEKESADIVSQLHNYPSITTWVLFNEKWGQYDQERLTNWLKKTDPSRLVNGHSGEYLYVDGVLRSPSPNAYVGADITDVHSYPDPMNSIKIVGKAQVCGEFGGIGVSIPDHQWNPAKAWGYIQVKPAELKEAYAKMVNQLKQLEGDGLSASIYTQPFDVEGEENGLMTYDRKVAKIPFAELRKINNLISKKIGDLKDPITEVAGNTDFDKRFQAALQHYHTGQNDTTFLVSVASMAKQAGENMLANEILGKYIPQLPRSVNKEQVEFIGQFLNDTSSPSFLFFQTNRDQVNQLMGERYAENMLSFAIFKQEIESFVPNKTANPDWELVRKAVGKFGNDGLEIYLRAKYIHKQNQKDWKGFAEAFQEYFVNFPKLTLRDLNNSAWSVFENLDDPKYLNFALEWSKTAIANHPHDLLPYIRINDMDTQSNLLYKLGKKEEGIAYQKKAIALAQSLKLKESDYMPLVDNLDKMLKNEQTWPFK